MAGGQTVVFLESTKMQNKQLMIPAMELFGTCFNYSDISPMEKIPALLKVLHSTCTDAAFVYCAELNLPIILFKNQQ